MRVSGFPAALILGLVAAFLTMSGALRAQNAPQFSPPATNVATTGAPEAIDYDAWRQVAERAEAALEVGRASDAAFETLRGEIAAWRANFLDAESQNQLRIRSIEDQLSVLGPAPEGEATESEEVARRRAELTGQLAELRAPVLVAIEAHRRASGIIVEIDDLIRARETEALFQTGPIPIVPGNWAIALAEFRTAWRATLSEVTRSWNSDIRQIEMRNSLPLVILLALIAAVLIWRGRAWARSAGHWMLRNSHRSGAVFGFLVSVGQIALPLLGVYALTEALFATGVPSLRLTLLLDNLPKWAVLILGLRWLADRLFSQHDGNRILPMDKPRRREAKAYAGFLAVLLAIRDALKEFASVEGFSDFSVAVLEFPVTLLIALIMFRFGQLMIRHMDFSTDNAERELRARLVGLLGRVVILVSVLAPILALAGYNTAASQLLYPAIATLGLLGLVAVLQRFTNDLYRMVMGQSDDEADSLATVLIGFLLALLSLPVLALIWGARVADLTELWTQINEGFSIGDTRISPTDFFVLIAVFLLGYMGTRLLQAALKNSILPKTNIDVGGQNAIVSGIGYVGIFIAAVISITSAGLDLSSLAIVAGALSVGIGFGLQNIVSNFVSGIILLIERPIAEGDWIEVGGVHGTVQRISVRSTRLETFDRYDVIIPNADFVSGTVSNYTRGNSIGRIIVPVGAAYGTDTRKVERILLNIARQHDLVLMNPEPAVDFIGFGADSLDFQIRAVLSDIGQGMAVRTEMRHQIIEAFTQEGIEVPFAQRDIWLRNPEALAPSAQSGAAKIATGPEHREEAGKAPAPRRIREPSPGEGLGESDGPGEGR